MKLKTAFSRQKVSFLFFSDLDDQKIVIRVLQDSNIDVISHIYTVTKHRSSLVKGDYDSVGPQYLQTTQDGEQGGFFSSLYQIIAVGTPKPTNKQQGWLGGWW